MLTPGSQNLTQPKLCENPNCAGSAGFADSGVEVGVGVTLCVGSAQLAGTHADPWGEPALVSLSTTFEIKNINMNFKKSFAYLHFSIF